MDSPKGNWEEGPTEIPRVSVILPAYNAAGTVGRAVDSVLGQTFRDFELVVVDDGSTDSTSEVVLSRRDDRVRCVKTANGGVAHARNHGLKASSGEFVAFLDADDAWLATKLERQLDTMIPRPSVGLCFTSAELVDGEFQKIGEDLAVSFTDYSEAFLTVGNIVPGGGSSAVVRRSALDTVGLFDPVLSQCADWDLWLRLSVETDLAPIGEALVHYTKSTDTMSSDPALLETDTFALLDKFFASPASRPYRRVRRRAYSTQWMVCAGTYLHARSLRDSLRCVTRGVLTEPRSASRPLLLPIRAVSRLLMKRMGTR